MRVVALIFSVLLFASPAFPQTRLLQVEGVGQVSATPDMASFTVGFEATERRAEDAMQAVVGVLPGIFEVLDEAGIEPRDRQTTQLSLNPVSENRNGQSRKISGFVARSTLAVRVRDLEQLGVIIDAVYQAGANQIGAISFGIEDETPYRDVALELAVLDATRKAEIMANAAGVTLGPIQSMNIGGSPSPQPVMRAMTMEASGVAIAEGELDIIASVYLSFEIR